MPRIPAPCAILAAMSAFGQSLPAASAIPSDDGLPGVLETYDSRPLRGGLFLLGLTNRFGGGDGMIRNGLFISRPDGQRVLVEDPFAYTGRLFLAAGVGKGFDLSLQLPLRYEYLPEAFSPPDEWGPGDASASLKWRLPFDIPFVAMSVFATGSAPTSAHSGPRLPYRLAYYPSSGRLPDGTSHGLGMDAPRAGGGAGTSLDFSEIAEGPEIKLHANVAVDRTMAGNRDNPLGTLAASLAAEAKLWGALRLETELRHQRLAAKPATLGEPLAHTTTLGLGLGARAGSGLALRAGTVLAPPGWNPYLPLILETRDGREFRTAYRIHPPVSAFIQLSWQGFPLERDIDHDAVPDAKDICPTVDEDRDGFQDDDGCPDPDNDQDGVLDGADRCPYVQEDHDGFEDRDGCPEPDNDHDALPDTADKCPNDPEDADGFRDADGCPDLDDDLDGIPDALDKCPHEAENRNGIEDDDGCAERDGDKDRIPDSRDKCPREAEIVNFYQDEDGCPDEKPEPIRDAVLAGVRFVGSTAELDPASFLVLDGLAARLFAYPGTEIEIQGHLDDRAGPRSKALSLERAESVVEYLINRGIEARRLKPIGYGSSKPIAPNRTAQGREANRRIQIRRLN